MGRSRERSVGKPPLATYSSRAERANDVFSSHSFFSRYPEPKRYSSNGRDMTVVLTRASNSPTDEEYMEVSYYFHDGKS